MDKDRIGPKVEFLNCAKAHFDGIRQEHSEGNCFQMNKHLVSERGTRNFGMYLRRK